MRPRSLPQLQPRHEVDTLAVDEAPQGRGSVYRYTVRSRIAVEVVRISQTGQISIDPVPVRGDAVNCRRYPRIKNVSQTMAVT
jgi:hypothetical protein